MSVLQQRRQKCLVLLGFHGVGKDTMFKLLEANHPGTYNAKFGALNKRLVAEMLNVCPSYLDAEPWRSSFNIMQTAYDIPGCALSPLDLLNVLFYGLQQPSKAADNLLQALVSYTLDRAKQAKLAVFTDVRRESEMSAIEQHFDPTVVYLRCSSVQAGEGDENVEDLAGYYAHGLLYRVPGNPLATYTDLVNLLEKLEPIEND